MYACNVMQGSSLGFNALYRSHFDIVLWSPGIEIVTHFGEMRGWHTHIHHNLTSMARIRRPPSRQVDIGFADTRRGIGKGAAVALPSRPGNGSRCSRIKLTSQVRIWGIQMDAADIKKATSLAACRRKWCGWFCHLCVLAAHWQSRSFQW